jgi:hypothetical protein
MGPSGGPITKDQTGVETYATIFTIAPSPHDASTIWTGSDDGYVQLTRDGGKSWANVTPPALPPFSRISLIEVSPHRPGTAYVAAKRYQLDDRAPYAYRTDDYGRTWTKITDGIPGNDFVHAIREDTQRERLLWAGAEHGIHISFDDGASWAKFNRNLPDVQVADIAVAGNDLVIGTHGRSAYIMDNISGLRQLDPRVVSAPVHLFVPVDPVRGADNSLVVSYHLAQPADSVRIDFLDAQGQLIRGFTGLRDTAAARLRAERSPAAITDDDEPGRAPARGPATAAGMNRFSWDLRYPGPTTFPNLIMWAASANGPRLIPGEYQVRLVADGQIRTQSFRLRPDPRVPDVTPADLQAQLELALKVRDATSAANESVILIRSVKEQVADRVGRDGSVRQQGAALTTRLSQVEEALYQVRNRSTQDPLNYPIRLNNKLAALLGAVEGVPGRPTRQAYQVFEMLKAQLDERLGSLRQILETDLASFNRLLQSRNLEPVVPRREPREVI